MKFKCFRLIAAVFLTGLFLLRLNVYSSDKVRSSAHAGQFYPASAEELSEMIDGFINESDKINFSGDIKCLWVPHAGYQFSGQIAANAYNCLKGLQYDLIVVIGPSHYYRLAGASIGDWSAYETPLGLVEVDTLTAGKMRAFSSLINCINSAHHSEHSLEVQIPFIQKVMPGVPIIPILIGFNTSYRECKKIAGTIVESCKGKKVLLIASSDMSHFPSYSYAYAVDRKILDAVESFNPKTVLKVNERIISQNIPSLDCTLCGLNTVLTAMMASRELNADKVQILPYANSGDIYGDRGRVVGYGAGIFYRESNKRNQSGDIDMGKINFNREEKKKLFQIARESIKQAIRQEKTPSFQITEKNLQFKRGVFVTLMNHGRLRGCLGHFEADYPLFSIISRMAAAAATQDYRFAYNPVTENEMKEINIKISILSKLKKVDSIDAVEVGKHGIWIKKGNRGGTYLPEVATEMGWNKIEFIEHCCAEKAGLPRDAWKEGAEIFIYTSQILDEMDL